jgi:hypothetical protein
VVGAGGWVVGEGGARRGLRGRGVCSRPAAQGAAVAKLAWSRPAPGAFRGGRGLRSDTDEERSAMSLQTVDHLSDVQV